MRVWLDDVRPKPHDYDVWVLDGDSALYLIHAGLVTEISLDHDLGEFSLKDGYDVAKEIEKGAVMGTIQPIIWHIHSANPVGARNMYNALVMADAHWRQNV